MCVFYVLYLWRKLWIFTQHHTELVAGRARAGDVDECYRKNNSVTPNAPPGMATCVTIVGTRQEWPGPGDSPNEEI
jgi:hypothetical protein